MAVRSDRVRVFVDGHEISGVTRRVEVVAEAGSACVVRLELFGLPTIGQDGSIHIAAGPTAAEAVPVAARGILLRGGEGQP